MEICVEDLLTEQETSQLDQIITSTAKQTARDDTQQEKGIISPDREKTTKTAECIDLTQVDTISAPAVPSSSLDSPTPSKRRKFIDLTQDDPMDESDDLLPALNAAGDFFIAEEEEEYDLADSQHIDNSPNIAESERDVDVCSSQAMPRTLRLNVTKNGLEHVDREAVNRQILQKTEGTKYYKREVEKHEKRRQKIAELRRYLNEVKVSQVDRTVVDSVIRKLDSTRILTKTWLHIDMDAFFASVEERDNPQLVGKPVAVGGMKMISTANYVARKYGVRSAMPGFIGKELVAKGGETLIFVKGSMTKYKAISREIEAILRCYDPDLQMRSIDEAAIDLSDYMSAKGVTAKQAAQTVKHHICDTLNLPCSVGVAANKFLAKVCCERGKPNGLFCLRKETVTIKKFVRGLKINKVPGIGPITEEQLEKALKVVTLEDLWESRYLLYKFVSQKRFESFMGSCLGLGSTRHYYPERKSIGKQRTFKVPERRLEFLLAQAQEICNSIAASLEAKEKMGKLVEIVMQTDKFEKLRSSAQLATYSDESSVIYEVVRNKLLSLDLNKTCLRCLSVRIKKLTDAASVKKSPSKQIKMTEYVTQQPAETMWASVPAKRPNELAEEEDGVPMPKKRKVTRKGPLDNFFQSLNFAREFILIEELL